MYVPLFVRWIIQFNSIQLSINPHKPCYVISQFYSSLKRQNVNFCMVVRLNHAHSPHKSCFHQLQKESVGRHRWCSLMLLGAYRALLLTFPMLNQLKHLWLPFRIIHSIKTLQKTMMSYRKTYDMMGLYPDWTLNPTQWAAVSNKYKNWEFLLPWVYHDARWVFLGSWRWRWRCDPAAAPGWPETVRSVP